MRQHQMRRHKHRFYEIVSRYIRQLLNIYLTWGDG
jgi:hypothetical protein